MLVTSTRDKPRACSCPCAWPTQTVSARGYWPGLRGPWSFTQTQASQAPVLAPTPATPAADLALQENLNLGAAGPHGGGQAGNLWRVEPAPSQHMICQGRVFLGKLLLRGTLFPASSSPSGAPRVHGQARGRGGGPRPPGKGPSPSEITNAFPPFGASA